MVRQAKLPTCSTRATRRPNTDWAVGCKSCCSNRAKAAASGQLAIKLLLKATPELCTRRVLFSGHATSGLLSACGVKRSEEVFNACWHSAGSSCSRQSLKLVSRFGVSRISSTAQGFQRGGTSSQPRQIASNRPASTTQRSRKARNKVMERSLSEQAQLLDLVLDLHLR